MTALWVACIAVGAIAGLAAGVWVIIIAFRESVGWGIACLFGVPALVFAVRYWEDVKVPFVYWLIGIVLGTTGVVGYSVSTVNAELENYDSYDDQYAWDTRSLVLPDEPDTTQDPISADVDGIDSTGESGEEGPTNTDGSDVDGELHENPEERPTPASLADRRRGFLVPLNDLEKYRGEHVAITLKNGERIFVYVVEFRPGWLEVQRSLGGGSVTFDVRIADIEEVRARKVL